MFVCLFKKRKKLKSYCFPKVYIHIYQVVDQNLLLVHNKKLQTNCCNFIYAPSFCICNLLEYCYFSRKETSSEEKDSLESQESKER